MIHTIFRAVEGSGRASQQPSFSPRASPLLSGPCLPNLGCEVLLLDVAAVMGFNGFPSPKVFRITPTIHNYNKTETKQTEF